MTVCEGWGWEAHLPWRLEKPPDHGLGLCMRCCQWKAQHIKLLHSHSTYKSFKKTKQKQTFVEKHHRCVARRGVFSQLVVSPFFWSEAARPDAPQPTCHKHKNLGVEPVTEQTTILHHPSILTTHTYGALLTDEEVLSSGNLLHDDNVDSIHRH